MTDKLQRAVVIDAGDVELVRTFATENAVMVRQLPSRGLEPVATVTLLLLGTSLAVGAVIYQVERLKGGQIIDLRDNAPRTIYRSKDLVYGLVVILATDGQVKIEVHEPRGMFGEVMDTLSKLALGLGKASVETVSKAAKEILGDRIAIASAVDGPDAEDVQN